MKEVKLFSTFPPITDLEIILVMFFPISLKRMKYCVLRQCHTCHVPFMALMCLWAQTNYCTSRGAVTRAAWGVAGVAAGRWKYEVPAPRPGQLYLQKDIRPWVSSGTAQRATPCIRATETSEVHFWVDSVTPARGRSDSLSDKSDGSIWNPFLY